MSTTYYVKKDPRGRGVWFAELMHESVLVCYHEFLPTETFVWAVHMEKALVRITQRFFDNARLRKWCIDIDGFAKDLEEVYLKKEGQKHEALPETKVRPPVEKSQPARDISPDETLPAGYTVYVEPDSEE